MPSGRSEAVVVDARRQVLRLLRRHGWNATSFQVLKPGFRYWFSDDGEAAVAYVDTGRHWMGAGAPICAAARLAPVAREFAVSARAAGRTAAFFGAVGRLVGALGDGGGFDALQVGSQAVWDPRGWAASVAGTSIPSQARRAARKGIEVREVPAEELTPGSPLRARAQQVMARWQRRHGMPPMRFLVDLHPFLARRERRYFGAFREGRLVALLAAVPIYARHGWFLENLLFQPPLPNGTNEALIDRAMRTLGEEGVEFATMGISALARLPGRDPRHPVLGRLLQVCYRGLEGLYGFQGVTRFQERLHPHGWESVYLVAHGRVGPGVVLAVLHAFAGGRMERFAVRALGRATLRALRKVRPADWARGLRLFAGLLLPWTALLLLADSERWFGSPWLGRAWASFDLAIAAALLALAHGVETRRPWVRPVGAALLGAVLADAWLTLAQAVLYNLPRTQGLWDRLLVAAACAAPPLAASFLGAMLAAAGGRGRQRRGGS